MKEPMSVYLDDSQSSTWFWQYQGNVDEWRFYADDYDPANSIKVTRRYGSPLSLVIRGTTMPKGVREVIMQSGLTLFEKSDASIFCVAMNKAVVMKAADDLLATIEWMKTCD